MNICESHQLGVSCDTEDAEGSRGVSGGPAQGGDVGATMETQCPVEDRLVRLRMVTLRWFVTEIEYGCTMDMRAGLRR